MKNKINRIKFWIITIITFGLFIGFGTVIYTPHAACVNQVPTPLNPDCDPSKDITAGTLINRVIGILPIGVTLVAVGVIMRGGFKIMLADDAEGRQEGFKGLINAALGVGVFYSIWIILYLIEQITGAQIIYFG